MPPFQFLPVEWRDALPSTNTALIERVRRDLNTPSGVVLAARAQTAGRGRQQRRWNTAPGRNLTFSFLWNTPVPPDIAPAMALAIATGVARMLEAEGLAPTIKWPNDVQVSGRKIAGILSSRPRRGARRRDPDSREHGRWGPPKIDQRHLARADGGVPCRHVLTSLLQHLGRLDAWAAHGFPGFGGLRFAPNRAASCGSGWGGVRGGRARRVQRPRRTRLRLPGGDSRMLLGRRTNVTPAPARRRPYFNRKIAKGGAIRHERHRHAPAQAV